jgi:hypothetical protein
MPFDPNLPQAGTLVDAVQIRAQLNALKALIDELHVQMDALPTDSELGEAIGGAVVGSSANTNAVSTLGFAVSDPPTQSEVQTIVNKLDEFINAARR